jgi:predicted RNA-binding protein with TRAM domain
MDEDGMGSFAEGGDSGQQMGPQGGAQEEGRGGGYGRGRGGRGGRGNREGINIKPSYFLPKPVKPGDEVDLTIEAVAAKGDGIAKKDGFVIFIKGAAQGEVVRARIVDVKARFAVGERI